MTYAGLEAYQPAGYLAPSMLSLLPVDMYPELPDWLIDYVITNLLQLKTSLLGEELLPTVIVQELQRRDSAALYYSVLAPVKSTITTITTSALLAALGGDLPSDTGLAAALTGLMQQNPRQCRRARDILVNGPRTVGDLKAVTSWLAQPFLSECSVSTINAMSIYTANSQGLLDQESQDRWREPRCKSDIIIMISAMLCPAESRTAVRAPFGSVLHAPLNGRAENLLSSFTAREWALLLGLAYEHRAAITTGLSYVFDELVPFVRAV